MLKWRTIFAKAVSLNHHKGRAVSPHCFGFLIFMTYQEQLQDPRWKTRREEILRRDWHMCQVCMSTKNLHIHHTTYFDGLMAWEYDGWYLKTLCADCHSLLHDKVKFTNPIRKISDCISDWVQWTLAGQPHIPR